MDTKEIHSLSEYIDFVEEISPQYSLSRGQEQDKDLLPSILRKDDNGMALYTKANSKSFIDDFKSNSTMYIDNTMIKNQNEVLVYAQHFGVPTCLLDFTYSHLISLMFAVENAFSYDLEDEEKSVVWFLDSRELNLRSINRTELLDLSEEISVDDRTELPFAVTVRRNNKRIAAQNGLFVFFPQNADPLNKISIADSVLKKVEISHKNRRKILKSLYTMGMRFDDIYPELASISKDIILKNNVMEYYKMENEND